MNVTWRCHVCNEERPDDKIDVMKTPLVIDGQRIGDQNVRYCNDRADCFRGSRDVNFGSGKP